MYLRIKIIKKKRELLEIRNQSEDHEKFEDSLDSYLFL